MSINSTINQLNREIWKQTCTVSVLPNGNSVLIIMTANPKNVSEGSWGLLLPSGRNVADGTCIEWLVYGGPEGVQKS